MKWFIEMQRWLYGGMSDGIRSANGMSGLSALIGGAFIFGMVHALMPGHGKSVLVSYHLGNKSRLIDGLMTGALLSVTHVGLAVVFVMAGVAVISRSLALAGRAPAFEAVSASLIILAGLFLLYRALWPSKHRHLQDGKALAFFTGLVPCPLTTFILIYAFAHNQLALGFVAVAAMLAGVIVTIAGFAVIAVLVRERFVHVFLRSEAVRERVGYWLEVAGAAGRPSSRAINTDRSCGRAPASTCPACDKPAGDVVLHDRDLARETVFVMQPLEDPLGRVPLLLRPIIVSHQDRINDADELCELRPERRLPAHVARRH